MADPVNPYTAARNTIRDTLATAGLNAFTTVPARATPPLAFAGPSDPYLSREDGRAFDVEVMRLDVVLVASRGVSDTQAAELDDMLVAALDALNPLDPEWVVRRVDQPGRISLAGQEYLAVSINVESEIQR